MSVPPTEARNPHTVAIDRLPTLEVLRLINAEDHRVAPAVAAVLPRIAEAVELAVAALRAGRRMHYFGAGTSGRLAVLDAAELHPTFGVGYERVVAHIAGGPSALQAAVEGAEDAPELGAAAAAGLGPGGVAVGAGGVGAAAGLGPRGVAVGAGDVAVGAAAGLGPRGVAVGAGDVAVGAAASGGTPYVGGALRAARAAGASTVLVS